MKKKFANVRKKSDKNFEVDITSLLDILVILLVFLLKSYNASDLTVDLVKSIELPDSRSQALGGHSIIVQVNKDKHVFINNRKIGTLLPNEQVSEVLLAELKKYKEAEEEKIKADEGRSLASIEKDELKRKKEKLKKVNIVLDKKLPYSILRQVMHTSATAGFSNFKFIVQGKFQ